MGAKTSLEALVPLVYDELKRLAGALLARERGGHTLQPTALAHEAWMRLVAATKVEWKDRAQVLAIAARSMRQILVDHARGKGRVKRGGGRERVTLVDVPEPAAEASALDVLALEEALADLSREDDRKARLVELRFYGGLTSKEAASVLGVSETTAEDDWAYARAWLRRRLGAGFR